MPARPPTVVAYIEAAPNGGSAHRSHMNFMPIGSALIPFKKELAKYKTGMGSIQFPYDEPLPKALIRRIAALRVKELREKDVRWM